MPLHPPLLHPATLRITTKVKKATTTPKGFKCDTTYPGLLRNTLCTTFPFYGANSFLHPAYSSGHCRTLLLVTTAHLHTHSLLIFKSNPTTTLLGEFT